MSTQLVIGASGLVGEHLLRIGAANQQMIGTFYSNSVSGMLRLDLGDRSQVQSLVERLAPAIVYLPAALTNVDYCETHPQEAYVINVAGVKHLVDVIENMKIKLVYFSTDYVFSGEAGPYREDDPVSPINEYGRQKLMAEQYISRRLRNYLIVRTTGVYGWERRGRNFVYRVLNTLGAGNILQVPQDQIASPTYAVNLAQAAIALAQSDATGIYNISGSTQVSRYDFACEIAQAFGLNVQLIEGVLTKELAQPARRPLNAGLIVDKVLTKISVPLLGYREGLRAMMQERGMGS